MVKIARSINYQKTIVNLIKEYWDEALLLFGFLMLMTYLSSVGSLDIAREGIVGWLGGFAGKAIIGYILISLGGALMLIPAGFTQVVGIIMLVIGWILAGASIAQVWSWVKDNALLAGGIFVGVVILWYNMHSTKRPKQNIVYNVYQTPKQ